MAGILTIITSVSVAQTASMSGSVVSTSGEPLVGVSVRVSGSNIGAITDESGVFTLLGVSAGNHELIFQAVGYQKQVHAVTVNPDSKNQLHIRLADATESLTEVEITGGTITSDLKNQGITVAAINTSGILAESSDAATVLDRVTGVRVRQSGGLGSSLNVSIQGLQGKAIRYYMNGVPLEFLGGGIAINNLPINQIERIEVYKGVMPVTVGTDALGGGINIVTRRHYKSYLDLSYQAGSFNTHRPVLNAHIQSKTGLFVALNGFLNYADNNYKIDVTNVNLETSKREKITAERFHDNYKAWYGDVQLGVNNKWWADELKYTIGYSDIYKQLQHGTVIRDIPVGDAYYANTAFLHHLNYEKENIIDGLNVTAYASFVNGQLTRRDSTSNFYDWYGNISPVRNSVGAELSRQPSNAKVDRTLYAGRINVSYLITPTHKIEFSNFYGQQKRKGDDEFGVRIAGRDPLTEPAVVIKNISGLAHSAQWFNNKLNTTIAVKQYYYLASSANITDNFATEFPVTSISGNFPGYSGAIKYDLSKQLSLKASYERTLRIPDETEIFGDFIDVGANPLLKPERSNNINLTVQWQKRAGERSFSAELNSFYRNQKDLIFLFVPPIGLGFYKNQNDAVAYGADMLIEVQPVKSFSLQASATYQDVRVVSNRFEDKDYDGNRIPNIPWFFFNVSPRYMRTDVFDSDDRLQIFSYFQFINEFPFVLEGRSRNDAVYVPSQQIISAGVSYGVLKDRITGTFEVNNLLDEKVYDNRSIQKPGRNFNIKLRYLIN